MADNEKKGPIIHMIGHAHIDPMFLWRWMEGYEAVKMTVRSALERMGETPDLVLSVSSAAFFDWLERWDPDLFDQVREQVQAGRWEIVGGWWIEPDCNVPGGESLVRQALYGQRFFREKFGVQARVGLNPDSFGHAASLPQILAKSGCPYYVFMRPSWYEKPLPENLFHWQSPDGSQVLTARLNSYVGHGQESEVENAKGFYPTRNKVLFFGVGDHGGGPTKEAIARVLAQRQAGEAIDFSTLGAFFQSVEAEDAPLPVVADELQHHSRGCYSTLAALKQLNRANEHQLMSAEKLCAMANLLAEAEYPAAAFQAAWRDLCFLQFHDTLGGTIPEEAYRDVLAQMGRVTITAQETLHGAMHALSNRIDTRGPGAPVLVFNPTAQPRQAPVEVVIDRRHWGLPTQVTVDWWRQGSVKVVDDQGRQVPAQLALPPAHCGAGRINVLFQAELPSLGYGVFHLEPSEADTPSSPALDASEDWLENERWRLEVDAATGQVTSLYDKVNELQVLVGPGNRAVVMDDPSDTWGHEMQRFDQELGCFGQAQVSLLERGPVRASLWVRSRFGDSRLEQIISLYAGSDQIEISSTLHWGERHRLLKIEWPVNVAVPTVTSHIPYGHITRLSYGDEEPCGAWIDVSGQARREMVQSVPYGVALINDGKPGYDVWARYRPYGWGAGKAIMRMTVLRSPIYVFHDPNLVQDDLPYAYQDQGVHRFRYAILPHEGSWQEAGVPQRAEAFNAPVQVMNAEVHKGEWSAQASWLSASPRNAQVTVVKRAEAGEGLVVRCVETDGQDTQARIDLHALGMSWTFALGHDEIKTFVVTRDGSVQETDLLEDPLEEMFG